MNKILSAALLLSSLVLPSCGGGAAEAKEQTIKLTANDQMQFSTKVMRMKVGETLTIEYENIGKMPVEAMGHNLIILKADVDAMKFGLAAVTAKDTNYIPADRSGEVLASCKLLGPGEKATVTFTPTAAGKYPYLCSFPGHVGSMRGTIYVK